MNLKAEGEVARLGLHSQWGATEVQPQSLPRWPPASCLSTHLALLFQNAIPLHTPHLQPVATTSEI